MSLDEDEEDRDTERYGRQMQLAGWGLEGQRKLARSSALIVGCGALGSTTAGTLARAGVGRIRLVDRDVLELSNLHRQTLYDEEDLGSPKAEVAARKLRQINSTLEIEAHVMHVDPSTVEGLLANMDLVLDGSDNFDVRYLINDACVKHSIPWIYGGVVGTWGLSLAILPQTGPCLRCLFPLPPQPGQAPSVETHGVLSTAASVIGSFQATEALKLLLGERPTTELLHVDLWQRTFQQVRVMRDTTCPCCVQRCFSFLVL